MLSTNFSTIPARHKSTTVLFRYHNGPGVLAVAVALVVVVVVVASRKLAEVLDGIRV